MKFNRPGKRSAAVQFSKDKNCGFDYNFLFLLIA